MRKKQVAVIDVGSSNITAVIGERGINKTFVIKGRFSYEYDGFDEGVFFDVDKFKRVLFTVGDRIKKETRGYIDTVYVGVPGEFVKVFVKDSQISFSKKKKIQESDVDALFDSAFVITTSKYTLINRSAILYELNDFRRLANPVGSTSEILKGKLSFVLCSNYFIEAVKPTLESAGIEKVECVSSDLAQALYLVEPETRDRIAVIVDVGHISTTVTIIQGDGLLYKDTFSYGGGYITAEISEHFAIDFELAEKLKRQVSLSSVAPTTGFNLIDGENGQFYSVDEIKELILRSLEILCENLSESLEGSGYSIPEYVPIMITGGGITYIRGAKEHLSKRLGASVEVVAPKIPLMNKPTESAILSLLDLALAQ